MRQNHKLVASLLPTEIKTVNFAQLRGYVKDLMGQYGSAATAEDLFHLLHPSSANLFYSKVVFTVHGESPLKFVAVAKLGKCFTLMMSNAAGAEYFSQSAANLISTVEQFAVAPKGERALETIAEVDTIKVKNLKKLHTAIDSAGKLKGVHAEVRDVFSEMLPGIQLRVGKYHFPVTGYDITFNRFLGHMVAHVVDDRNFTQQTVKAKDLLAAIGGKK